jgi:hypothetical protein
MYQPVTWAPLALVVAEATTLKVVGTVELLAGELTVTVTVAKAGAAAARSRTARIGRIRWVFIREDLHDSFQRASTAAGGKHAGNT